MNKKVEAEKGGEPEMLGDQARPLCGLVMPIAAMGDYSENHWISVEQILREAISSAGFDSKLVSQETSSGVIHQRIVTNLYTNRLVVCDVSGRNPNVMFELGMRLAFDKPTIIVKDDVTPFSFDISGIEHVQYASSLRYGDIVDFKERLADKVAATAKAAENPEYSTFLRHVGGLVPAKLDVKEVPIQEFMSKQMDQIMMRLDRMEAPYQGKGPRSTTRSTSSAAKNQFLLDSNIGVLDDTPSNQVFRFVVSGGELSKIESSKFEIFGVPGVIGVAFENVSSESAEIVVQMYGHFDSALGRIVSILKGVGGTVSWVRER